MISLSATQLTETDEASIADIIATAESIFKTSERTFCGPMIYELKNYDEDSSIDVGFIKMDKDLQQVTIEPLAAHDSGVYD